jgi:hypothetical protein
MKFFRFQGQVIDFLKEKTRLAGEMGETETARGGELSRVILGLGDRVRPHLTP